MSEPQLVPLPQKRRAREFVDVSVEEPTERPKIKGGDIVRYQGSDWQVLRTGAYVNGKKRQLVLQQTGPNPRRVAVDPGDVEIV